MTWIGDLQDADFMLGEVIRNAETPGQRERIKAVLRLATEQVEAAEEKAEPAAYTSGVVGAIRKRRVTEQQDTDRKEEQ